MFFLDGGDIGEVDAGECIVAFGTLLFATGSRDDFAVKDNIDTMCFLAGGEPETVGQIGFGVCD